MGEMTYPFSAVLEFETREALIGYLTHPRHAELGRMFWELCESTTVTEVETHDMASPDVVEFLMEGARQQGIVGD